MAKRGSVLRNLGFGGPAMGEAVAMPYLGIGNVLLDDDWKAMTRARPVAW